MGSTHPLLVTRGLIPNPGLLTNLVPAWVGKDHSQSPARGVLGSGGSGEGRAEYRTSGVAGWPVQLQAHSRSIQLKGGPGTGSQDCVEAFAHSSVSNGLMLLGEGRPPFLPGPWTGVGWAAGGLATYLPLGYGLQPGTTSHPRRCGPKPNSRERPRWPLSGEPCGAQGHPGSSAPASTEHSSQEPGVALSSRACQGPSPCSLLSTSPVCPGETCLLSQDTARPSPVLRERRAG